MKNKHMAEDSLQSSSPPIIMLLIGPVPMGQHKLFVPHCDSHALQLPHTKRHVQVGLTPTSATTRRSRPTSSIITTPLTSCTHPHAACYGCHHNHDFTPLTMSGRTRGRTASRVCEYCGGEFYRKEHYERHVRTHTRERPFSCSRCSSRFSRRSVVPHRCSVLRPLPLSFADTPEEIPCVGTCNRVSLALKL
jgi:hypothetical protein